MAFTDFPDQQQGVELLQRSLERRRLGHAYLFTGHHIEPLEALARTLAKTLNCQNPIKRNGAPVDCCDRCVSCRKIDHGNHADVHLVRPESKTRIITVEQIRELMKEIQLKPTEAEYKVAVIVCADRLRTEAANAFLKTLEEPPPNSILILLSTEPQRILETILSRCLRLNFGGAALNRLPPDQLEWLARFSEMAAAQQKSLLGRYRLMDVLVSKLSELKSAIEGSLTARSPLQQYKDAEDDLVERWESELTASIEAEYRRQRTDLLSALQWWLRDVWLQSLRLRARDRAPVPKEKGSITSTAGPEPQDQNSGELLAFPQLRGTEHVARRITSAEAVQNLQVLEQLQRWLYTNVQESLALEVGLLKLRL